MRGRASIAFFAVLVCALVVASCAQEDYPLGLWVAQHAPPADAGAGGAPADATVTGPRACIQTHATSLPARLVAMSANAQSASAVVLVSDLFARFTEVCGSCHGPSIDPPGQGGFQIVTASDFKRLMTASQLQHVTASVCPGAPNANDPNDPMPPCSSPNGETYTQRSAGDPVRQLAELTKAWLDAGSPNSFTPPSAAPAGDAGDGGDAGAVSQYLLTPQTGNSMTNIGNCVPTASMVGVEDVKSVALDAMFAGLKSNPSGTAAQVIGLPEHLSDTDLFTFDSAELAQYGVVAYAPAYPLWSDNAGKLRHVRVPRGQSIHFDKATQKFDIPPNTRFYKTFMKQIIDTDGSYRYRKMETRLIVARPDVTNVDGSVTQTALFGTYQWNASETDAVLLETPLNSGLPFADTLLTYNTDEGLAAQILATQPADPQEALLEAHAVRHYAIPSSQRCVQCHMGSPSADFVLGFNPLQINRRPTGQGGIIEAAGPDELTQLQRFIEAGIITGIDSPSDVLPLEQSEGSRAPRNNYELVAQGYMLGNCAHCHNPRGLPTVQNPVLRDVFNLMPGPTGGIFQFPLERYSPRIFRGISATTPIPYITPSLVDLPRYDPATRNQAPDIFVRQGSTGPDVVDLAIYAPWRSLIYRNTDAAFAYVDDLAIYPHMPMNTAGYDPRIKQILSDWMVSIPAVRKHPEIPEYAFQTDASPLDNIGGPSVDTTPQPYVEVMPGSPEYDTAVTAAQQRLSILHSDINPAFPTDPQSGVLYSRYTDPGNTSDILDPAVLADPICHPIPTPDGSSYPLPNHPHWVSTDLSQNPGPWAPRQSNWPTVLVEQNIPPLGGGCSSPAGVVAAYADQVDAVSLLPDATLDQVRGYATTPLPFGLWQQKAGCDFSSAKKVSDFTGAQQPHWMTVTNPPPDAPVFQQTPGAAVFKMICINCHGPRADSNGRMAQNLATMTGGNAQVADFRDGLFGPVGASAGHRNMDAVYSVLPSDASAKWTGVTVDDRAARYMAWMGLGGTAVNIPTQILQLVAVTKVLDQQRLAAGSLSANMLSQAKSLCLSLLGTSFVDDLRGKSVFTPGAGHGYLDPGNSLDTRLIKVNGDAELWLTLCAQGNPHPLQILQPSPDGSLSLKVAVITDKSDNLVIDGANGEAPGSILPASSYPAGQPVGNAAGGTDPSLVATNLWPWCVDERAATSSQAAWISSAGLPICPGSVKAASDACLHGQSPATGTCFGNDEANRWAVRGAINAGFSVFLYVQSIENSSPPPDYNQCELLP